jgi:exonuclease III
VRIVAWNILHGGGARRMPEVVLSLLGLDPDLVVLTEYRTTVGGQIRGVLADHGLSHQACTDPPRGVNGVLIASRRSVRVRPDSLDAGHPDGQSAWHRRWLEVLLPDLGLSLAGLHIPDEGRPTERAAFWQGVVGVARRRVSEPSVLIGDFNTGRPMVDGRAGAFTCAELLGTLWTLGYRDAWRELHPNAHEPTWVGAGPVGTPWGGALRIDAAFVSPAVLPAVVGAWHSHAERESGVSDHSAVVLDVDWPARALPPPEAR